MDFPRRPRLLAPTVERVVYGRGIRAAMGELDAIAALRPPMVVLQLPPGGDERSYLDAAGFVMLGAPGGERLRLLAPRRDRRGKLLFDEVMGEIAEQRGVLVLVQDARTIPEKLRAAADVIADIPPVAAEDLLAAAKEVLGLVLTSRQADELLALPLELALVAMRRGRSFGEILAALEDREIAACPEVPRLETLGGYGDARRWGLDLALDVEAWRRGELAWSEVDAGLLLSGPPGTGKTLYAAALARTCDLAFVATSVAQWQATGHLGDLLAAMRTSFKTAAEAAPSLLFIDEFDSIGDRARFPSHHSSYSTQVVNGLLEAMDGSSRRDGVVVVGATNNSQAIDPAFLRAGRLGRHIQIALPAVEDRVVIADTYLKGTCSKHELWQIAAAADGLSGAEIEAVVKEARRRARREEVPLDARLVLSCLPPSLPLAGEERWVASVHEAGHAVVGIALGFGELKSVGVVAEVRASQTMAGGAFFQAKASIVRSEQSYLDELCLRLAGAAAERVIVGSLTDGAGAGTASDLAVASDVATQMVADFGMGTSLGHMNTSGMDDRRQLRRRNGALEREVARLLADQLGRAESIVRERLADVEALARRLVESGTLSGEEVASLLATTDRCGAQTS